MSGGDCRFPIDTRLELGFVHWLLGPAARSATVAPIGTAYDQGIEHGWWIGDAVRLSSSVSSSRFGKWTRMIYGLTG